MTEEDQVENLRKCPTDVDVIVSHGPPYGVADLTAGWRKEPPQHVGSVALLDRMYELPALRLVACGHIHPAYGEYRYQAGTQKVHVVGGSLVNEDYKVANPPIVVDL
jgi:Icc-related predicted phosphoesterase